MAEVRNNYRELIAAQYSSSAVPQVEDTDTMLCRVVIKTPGEKDDGPTLQKPREVPDIDNSIRQSWVKGIEQFVKDMAEYPHIRPLDFHLFLNGSVELNPSDQESSNSNPSNYPPRYRIPPETITDLTAAEKVRRAEVFALGSLIYEVYANEAPYENLGDGEIQARYRRAEFPDVTRLPQWPLILSCWSVEFARELEAILSKLLFMPVCLFPLQDYRDNSNCFDPLLGNPESKFKRLSRAAGTYISEHPVRFGIQCVGAVVGIAATVALPVLGAAGFGALGPVAGSSAAAWQASIGAVEAGSLFAWCQSAAMGGMAVNGIIATGATGGAILLSSTAVGLLMDGSMNKGDEEKLTGLFQSVCRKSET